MKKVLSLVLCIAIICSLALSVSAISTVAVKGISIDKTSLSMKAGDTYALKITYTPADTTQKLLTFSTTNKNVAAVDKTGKIIAVRAGKATITVASSSNSKLVKKCDVVVSGGIDISKKVTLQFFMLGNAPRDLKIIQNEVNKLALKDLNCEVKYNFTTWSDTSTKYNLLLSAGQNVDLIFTADWMNYNQYALKGAFLPLEDVVPKAAPELWSWIPSNFWNAVKVNKHIYTIPATWKEYVPEGVQWREDLRIKYGCAPITNLDTLEAYLEAIKKNETTMVPTECLVADWGSGGPSFTAFGCIFNFKYTSDFFNYGLMNNYKSPSTAIDYWASDDFAKDAAILKRWQDKGFWSKSALSTKAYPDDEFENGKVAALLAQNPGKYATSMSKVNQNHPDWKIGYLAGADVTGYVVPVHPVHNGFAVPKSSKNAERAVAFYSKMVLDKEYNYLTEYGIEGVNFSVTRDGHYDMIGDVKTNGFARENMNGWAWRNPEIQLFDPSFDIVLDLFKKYDKVAADNIWGGFVEDYTPYQTERTALYQVQSQYLCPLLGGFVSDVDAGVKTFREKAAAAGLKKVQDGFTKQWQAYCKEMGYK
jgi:putative aldouronate transport system substrate-binding protein